MRDRRKEMLNTPKGPDGPALPPGITLHGWQQDVVDAVEAHEELRESPEWVGHPEYKLNKDLGIFVAMPRGSGHTFLANYLAAKFPVLLVYGNMNHYREVTGHFPLHPQTETVSLYEVFYSVFKPSNHQPPVEFLNLQKRFEGKKAVVVDNGWSLENNLKDVIFNTSQSAVVLLGH